MCSQCHFSIFFSLFPYNIIFYWAVSGQAKSHSDAYISDSAIITFIHIKIVEQFVMFRKSKICLINKAAKCCHSHSKEPVECHFNQAVASRLYFT